MKYYQDWEEAAEQSLTGRAVATTLIEHEGKMMKAEIIKAKGRDGMVNFWHTAIPIRKATAREIDGIKKWKSV